MVFLRLFDRRTKLQSHFNINSLGFQWTFVKTDYYFKQLEGSKSTCSPHTTLFSLSAIFLFFCSVNQNWIKDKTLKAALIFHYVSSCEHLSCVMVKCLRVMESVDCEFAWNWKKPTCDILSWHSHSGKVGSSIFIQHMLSRCQKQHCQRDRKEDRRAATNPQEMWTVWISGVMWKFRGANFHFICCTTLLCWARKVQVGQSVSHLCCRPSLNH